MRISDELSLGRDLLHVTKEAVTIEEKTDTFSHTKIKYVCSSEDNFVRA